MKERDWPQWWMVVGVLLAIGTLLTVGKVTLVSMSLLLRLLVGCCLIGVLVPWRWTGATWGFTRVEWHLLLMLGVGPTVFSSVLLFNRVFHGPVQRAPRVVEERVATGFIWRVRLAQEALNDHPGAREFYDDPLVDVGDTLWIGIARGGLGMPVVVERSPAL